MKYLALFTLLLCVFLATAQKEIPEFGDVSKEELLLTDCPFERGASAMKIFDVTETELYFFSFESRQKTERRVRIKIFNNNGFEHGSVKIPYLNMKGMAKIKDLKAIIYNIDKDGKVHTQKLERKDFLKEKAIEYIGLVNFTFPNLTAGSVIEYKYTTVENNIVYFQPWDIQDEIPVLYTSKTIIIPEETALFERVLGTDTISKQDDFYRKGKYRRIIYQKENVPAFKAEPFMTSAKDNLIRLTFLFFRFGAAFYMASKNQPEKIWNTIGTQFIDNPFFRNQVLKPIPGPDKIVDSAKRIEKTEERIRYIFEEVQKQFIGKPEQTISADSIAHAWQKQEATTAEINLFLLNSLHLSGVSCLPILVSTRENGKVNTSFPSLGQFNGIDVLAFDSLKVFVLDASNKFQSYRNPPFNILNREVLAITTDTAQWITITDDRPLIKQITYISGDFNKEGKFEGFCTVQSFDYAKSFKLDTSSSFFQKKDEAHLDKLANNIKILSTTVQKREKNEDEPYLETIDFLYEPQNTGDFYFINPQILNEQSKNTFTSTKRETDIDLGCNQLHNLGMEIKFPSALFEVEHLPKNITLRAPDSSFFYKISYSVNKESILVTQQFEVKRAMYYKEEYPGLREFFSKLYGLMSEEIILKRKK